MRSLNAYLLPRLWPSTMCASSCASTAARLASSGSTSTNPAADHDGIAHAEGFKRRGEQHASAYRTRQVDVVGDLQIVDHGLKNVVDVAFRRKQSRAGEALDDVIFRLLLPLPLSLQRRSILRRGAFILHAVHTNLREFVVLVAFLQVVAPDAGLRLEGHLVLHASAEVAFFAVNVGGNPVARNQVQAPAIHVEEERILRRRSVGAIQADNVVVLDLPPRRGPGIVPSRNSSWA